MKKTRSAAEPRAIKIPRIPKIQKKKPKIPSLPKRLKSWKNSKTKDSIGSKTRSNRKSATPETRDEVYALVEFDKANNSVKEKYYLRAINQYEETIAYTMNYDLIRQAYSALADVRITLMNQVETTEEEKKKIGESTAEVLEDAIGLISKEDPNDPIVISLRYKLGNIFYALGEKDHAYFQYSVVNQKPRFQTETAFSPEHSGSTNNEDVKERKRKIDESATEEVSFNEWKENILFTNETKEKREPMYVDAATLGQMMYNHALLEFNDGVYDVAVSSLLDVYRYKLLSPDFVPHIHEFEIAYYLGRAYFHLGNAYWGAVLLETFLRLFESDNPSAEDYDVGLIHILLGEIYAENTIWLALQHNFQYLADFMGFKNRNPRSIILHRIGNFAGRGEVVSIFTKMGNLFLKEESYHRSAHCLREAYEALEADEEDPEHLLDLLQKIYYSYDKLDIGDTLEIEIWVLKELVDRMERMIKVGYSLSPEALASNCNELGEKLVKKNRDISGGVLYLNKFLTFAKADDPQIVTTKDLIARTYYLQGEMDKALTMCEDAEKSALVFKDDHLLVNILCMKGSIHARRNDLKAFIAAFQEALKLKRSLLGDKHVDVATILHLYGTIFYELCHYEESVDCFLEAFSILKYYDDARDKCIEALKGTVRGYKKMKYYDSALATCKKILDMQSEFNEKTAFTLETMGDLHFERGGWSNYVNAAELYRESACILRKYEAGHSEQVLDLYEKLASVQYLLDENGASLKAFGLVVKSYQVSYNDGGQSLVPLVLLDAVEGQGDILFKRKQFVLALNRYEKTLRFVKLLEKRPLSKVQKEKLANTRIILLLKIGRTHSRTEMFVEAIQSLSKGFRLITTRSSGKYSVDITSCHYLYELGLACGGMGEDNLAKENFQKASSFFQHIGPLDKSGEQLKVAVNRELQLLNRGKNCMLKDCEFC